MPSAICTAEMLSLLACVGRFSVAAAAFWPFLKEANKEVWKGGLELGFWAGAECLLVCSKPVSCKPVSLLLTVLVCKS